MNEKCKQYILKEKYRLEYRLYLKYVKNILKFINN